MGGEIRPTPSPKNEYALPTKLQGGKAGEADPSNEGGDRRPTEWDGCGVPGRCQPQEKAAGGVPAPVPRREQ